MGKGAGEVNMVEVYVVKEGGGVGGDGGEGTCW